VVGRFGWKAGQPNVNQQNVHAFAGDMGLTSTLQPKDDCTRPRPLPGRAQWRWRRWRERSQRQHPAPGHLLHPQPGRAGPPRRGAPQVLAGKNLFYQAGCQGCHTPQFTTAADAAEPELANQVIRPYSDLLLHDMGPGLADERTEFAANGQDWRTAPLWGIGLSKPSVATASSCTTAAPATCSKPCSGTAAKPGGAQQVLTFNAEQRARCWRS
jgi:CxxC motif-containing protein (DUF1111 family)